MTLLGRLILNFVLVVLKYIICVGLCNLKISLTILIE